MFFGMVKPGFNLKEFLDALRRVYPKDGSPNRLITDRPINEV